MDGAAVLAAFDEQIRRRPEAGLGAAVEHVAQVVRVVASGDGWSGVTWSELSDADVDAVIAAQVHRFTGRRWEWKYYSYDRPLTLPGRLRAARLVADEVEALMVAQISDLDLAVPPPEGVQLVPVVDADGVEVLGSA